MSPDKEEFVVEWKAGIAANKASRKSIYTAASALVGIIAAAPAVTKLNALCAQFGLDTVDAICSVPEAQISIAAGTAIAAGLDWLLQWGRNYLKHKLMLPLP